MATGRERRHPASYERRTVRGHDTVRAVWVRRAGVLTGTPTAVVARTFAAVVLDLGAGEPSVTVRALGVRGGTLLSPLAVGFDAHPWAGGARLERLERAIHRAIRQVPGHDLHRLIGAVLDHTDVGAPDDQAVRLATTTLEHDPSRRAQASLPSRSAVSPRSLRRRFHASTGLSAEHYRVVARAARARDLLVRTDAPLAEIAWRLGYADQPHLHRHVLAHSGYTPTEWRARRHDWAVSDQPAS